MILLRSYYEWLFLAIKICRDIQDGAILGTEDETGDGLSATCIRLKEL